MRCCEEAWGARCAGEHMSQYSLRAWKHLSLALIPNPRVRHCDSLPQAVAIPGFPVFSDFFSLIFMPVRVSNSHPNLISSPCYMSLHRHSHLPGFCCAPSA